MIIPVHPAFLQDLGLGLINLSTQEVRFGIFNSSLPNGAPLISDPGMGAPVAWAALGNKTWINAALQSDPISLAVPVNQLFNTAALYLTVTGRVLSLIYFTPPFRTTTGPVQVMPPGGIWFSLS